MDSLTYIDIRFQFFFPYIKNVFLDFTFLFDLILILIVFTFIYKLYISKQGKVGKGGKELHP